MATTTATTDLSKEWRRCYLKAMGLELFLENDDDNQLTRNNAKVASSSYQRSSKIINLLQDTSNEDDSDEFDSDDEQYEDDDEYSHRGSENKREKKVVKNEYDDNTKDPWMSTALQIQSNLISMSRWMQKKKSSYISLTMLSDNEASLIQSTIMTFIATSANEIESLDRLLQQEQQHMEQLHQRQQYMQHCYGIVQILRDQLKESIIIPFNNQYLKQRNRLAIKIWQNPLQCHYYNNIKAIQKQKKTLKDNQRLDSTAAALLGLDDDEDHDDDNRSGQVKQFVPTRPSHRLHQDFYNSYEQKQPHRSLSSIRRPKSIFCTNGDDGANDEKNEPFKYNDREKKSLTDINDNTRQKTSGSSSFASLFMRRNDNSNNNTRNNATGFTYNDYNNNNSGTVGEEGEFYYYTDNNELEQESALLTATLNSDLDSVQKMEQMMVDITTLISQFAELAQEQQEDVLDIHKSTADTKQNMVAGQNSLIDAKERTASSKHYQAKLIALLGLLLLLFNWLRP